MNDENPYQSPGTHGEWRKVDDAAEPDEQDTLDHSFALFTSCSNTPEAQLYQALLRQHGIDSHLENANTFGSAYVGALGGIRLYIPASAMEDAVEIFKDGLPKLDESASTEDITFECEECGKEITFPGSRRGKTESCPKCHEYVDVPE
ncbi:hypothetical protein [Aeoliella sp. SH292]|uniref:hypothetical protein n=1 Tax=Aeoliella sp. SH292 TaxID=3454464 RepID=UPI003F970EEA